MENRRLLYIVDERIKTFEKWPFNDTHTCNVQRMAEAGFYSVATNDDDIDAAKCFLCGKELDGWEPDDDPWLEHKSHAPQCAFVQLGKKGDELTLMEFIPVMKQYYINCYASIAATCKDSIDERSKKILRRLKYRK